MEKDNLWTTLAHHTYVARRVYEGDRTLIIFASTYEEAKQKAQKAFGLNSVFVEPLLATDDAQVWEI